MENYGIELKLRIYSCQPDECSVANSFHSIDIVAVLQLNLDRLLARMWEEMGLVRVYSKPQGQPPDFTDPFVLSTVSICALYIPFG